MRALSYALSGGLLAALLMALGGVFLRHEFTEGLRRVEDEKTRALATFLQQGAEAHALEEQKLLTHVCTRDLHVERLSLELSAGGSDPEGARRAADTLKGVLAAHVIVAQTSRSGLSVLSESRGAPRVSLQRAALERARQERIVERDVEGGRWLMRACTRQHGAGDLWVITLRALEDVVPSKLPRESGLVLAFVEDGVQDKPGADVLSLPSQTGDALVLRLESTRAPALHTDLALALSVLASFLLAGAIGFLFGKRAEQHEQALSTIEHAAERVAQGDLVSAIQTSLSERADRTFRTFDRMTKELREMRERLAEAEREAAFRDVARRIAHEIKNPLSPIQISIETLRRAHAKQRPDFADIFEESTRAILEEVRRLERIVREFSEFARLPKPKPGALDLRELVRDTVGLYVPEGVALELLLDDDVPLVRADREQLTQVLVNLLKNALDAARTEDPPRLWLSVRPSPRGVTLLVGDNGPGIAESERERVFEPYFTTKDHGTGLGLAIVKRIVNDHGGSIEVGRSPLGGASIEVTLPLEGPH